MLTLMIQQTVPAQPGIGESIQASLTGAVATIVLWVPRLFAFIVIILIGWLISALIAKLIAKGLRVMKFDEVLAKVGVHTRRLTSGSDSADVAAAVVKWIIRFVVLLIAFDALGLPALSDVLRQFLLWLPNLIVAIVVLILAGLGARALGKIVRGTSAEAGFTNPDTLANVAKTAVWIFALVIVVNQIGIAQTLVNTLFTGAVAAVALASGIAFGLGGRDLANRTLEGWYDASQDVKGQLKDASGPRGTDPFV